MALLADVLQEEMGGNYAFQEVAGSEVLIFQGFDDVLGRGGLGIVGLQEGGEWGELGGVSGGLFGEVDAFKQLGNRRPYPFSEHFEKLDYLIWASIFQFLPMVSPGYAVPFYFLTSAEWDKQ